MNHTHYAVINEDRDVIAVIKILATTKEPNLDALTQAIQDDLDAEILRIDIEESDYMNFKVQVKLEDGLKETFHLRPTWEY